MKVEVKKVDALVRELKFEVPKDRVSTTMNEVFASISKNAKVKGFRPGKVPRQMLESRYSKVAQEETIRNLIPQIYQEGIQQENLKPIDMPEITDVTLKDGVLNFTAKLEVRPDVKVEKYKGIKVQRKSAQVTDEEINKTLEFFKKGQGKEGEEVKLDDTFARGLGFASLEDFKKSLARQMEFDKERHNRMELEQQIIDELLKNAKLTLPQSLVKKQLEHRMRDAANRLKKQGMKDEDLKNREEEMRKELQPIVERDVQVYLVFEKIAEAENIQVQEGESLPGKVMEFLFKEAKWEES